MFLQENYFHNDYRKKRIKIFNENISCECKYRFDGKYNPDQWWNNENVYVSIKNVMYVKKIIFGTLLHVAAKI